MVHTNKPNAPSSAGTTVTKKGDSDGYGGEHVRCSGGGGYKSEYDGDSFTQVDGAGGTGDGPPGSSCGYRDASTLSDLATSSVGYVSFVRVLLNLKEMSAAMFLSCIGYKGRPFEAAVICSPSDLSAPPKYCFSYQYDQQ